MAQQEGLNQKEEYFDIMLVGMTGQGKSTTAEKLLIANPHGNKCDCPPKTDSLEESLTKSISLENFSIWQVHTDDDIEEFTKYLTRLVRFGSLKDPHLMVNTVRSSSDMATKFCQVLSNDATNVRVLDVPGFNDSKAYDSDATATRESLYEASVGITSANIGITRNVIRIQADLGMCFRRVLYFLPCRGPLERSSALLKLELKQFEYVFGRPVFESMIAVATVPDHYSLKNEPDIEKFPQKWFEQCEKHFTEALRAVLGDEDVPKVPTIFISLSEPCESILEKVKGAKVSHDYLVLEFNPSTCASCGRRIGRWDGEGITCSTLQGPESSISYEESTCHPAFKRSLLSYVLGPKMMEKITRKWPSYKGECCVACEKQPGMLGCLKIGQKYKTWWGKEYTVDHTSTVTAPVEEPIREEPIREADQPGIPMEVLAPREDETADQGILPTPSNDHPELRANQFGGGAQSLEGKN